MSSFLDDFQSNLDSLPHIIQRKYSLLRDLDKSLQEIQRQSEQHCGNETEQLIREIKSGDITPDVSNIKFSDEAIDEQKHAVRIADEKVALAVQAYDLVDAHIQQLDQYMKKFNEELQREKETVSSTGSTAQSAESNLKSGKGAESGRGGRKKSRLSAASTASSTTDASAANPTSMDLDLPVDPNEPTYCLCNQVSFGEMVGCDNADCKIEWFHFGCVGLKEKPKGKWYCPECSAKKNKRKGK